MKKTFIPAALLCLALCAALLIGCTPASQPQTHTISFYAEGERVAVLETAGNETLALPEAPQKSGSVFSGWFLGEEEDARQLLSDTFASEPLTEDLSAYARYTAEETPDPDPDPDPDPEPEKHTITFRADGAVVGTVQTAGNEEITLPAAPGKEGHTFAGWYFDEGVWERRLKEDTYLHTALTEDTDVYAKYDRLPDPEPEKHTITFRADGAVVGTVKTAGNEEITFPEAPGKDGHAFAGWYFDEGVWERRLKEDTYLHTALTDDTDVYAKYDRLPDPEPEKHTITFRADGAVVGTVKTAGNEEITFPEAPGKDGHTFAGSTAPSRLRATRRTMSSPSKKSSCRRA